MVREAEELLHADLNLFVHLGRHLISHEERTHRLEGADLEREVEWRDDAHAAEWHANASRRLPGVVARHAERAREVADLIKIRYGRGSESNCEKDSHEM